MTQYPIYYEFGSFRLLLNERLLLRDGEPVSLRPKVFETLLVLVQNSGRVLTKHELMDLIWQKKIVEEGNLTQYIFTIRKLLGESPGDHKFVVTLPGDGYKFIAKVKEVFEEPTASDIWSDNLARSYSITAIKSIAILPLKMLSLDLNDTFMGVGIADALITRLNKIHQLVIRPTTAVLKYNDSEQNPLKAGYELNVDAVLDGTIQKVDDLIRVSTQLLFIRNKKILWAATFDGKFTNIFALQDSLATQIANELALELNVEEKKQLTKKYTENIEAYQLYIKGRYFFEKRTEAGIKKGIECALEIIKLDPEFALAYVALADSYTLLAEYLYSSPHESFPKAKAAALKALELDNTLAEPHASLAEVALFYEWDWEKAEKLYRLAIEKSPNYSSAHHWYAWLLLTQKRFDESLSKIEDALVIDPNSLTLRTVRGMPFYFNRQYSQAMKQFEQVLQMEPDFPQARYYLGEALLHQGLYEEAASEFERVKSSEYEQQATALLGYTLAISKREKEAKQVLKHLKEMSRQKYVSPYCEAIICAGLGDKEKTFDLLEKSYNERASWMIFLNVDPWFDGLRSDKRFSNLLSRLRLDN